MPNEQGTGKHPHKSTEEPYPHHERKTTKGSDERGGEHSRQSSGREEGGRGRQEGQSSNSSDLKEREYRDAQGNVHHHTHTYEEQHGQK